MSSKPTNRFFRSGGSHSQTEEARARRQEEEAARVTREATAKRAYELSQTASRLESSLASVNPLSDEGEVGRWMTELSAIRRMLKSTVAPVAPPTINHHREDASLRLEAYQSERRRLLEDELPVLERRLREPVPNNPAAQFKPNLNADTSGGGVASQAAAYEQTRQERHYGPIRQSIEAIHTRVEELGELILNEKPND